jgi:phenylacetate-CoA ligase
MVHPGLVRHVLAPLHERLLGRRTFGCLHELEDSQWWTRQRLRAMQQRKLRRLLIESYASCLYYRRLFDDRGIDVRADDPFAALADLPLLGKTTIRAHLGEMTNHRVPGGPIRYNTGGSTGEPLVFFIDRRRIAYDKAARMLTHVWFGAEPGSREVYLWGAPRELRVQDRLRNLRDRATNELLLDAFNLTPARMADYLRRIREYQPVSLFGYPSSLAMLATYGEATGQPFRGSNLRAVFATGEWLAPHDRRTLQRYFRAPVANGYGSRDGGFIAHECSAGGMHVIEQNVLIEIVDDTGQPLPDGHTGEIVVTHLDAWATPLLRYRTGDLGRLDAERCRCGRTLRLMGVVAGRRTDHLVASDGTLQHALSAIYVIRKLATVRQFQVRQDGQRNVNVAIVPERGFTERDAGAIRTELHQRLGADLDIRIQLVKHIPTENSGKFRCVMSEAADGPIVKTQSSAPVEASA